MIFFALTLALVGATPLENALQSSEQMARLFREYENEQGNVYSADESKLRLRLFRKSVKSVVDTNAADLGWKAGLNMFSDMTEEERQQYLGLNVSLPLDVPMTLAAPAAAPAASSLDWREKGGVTPVKNQGRCGSCWSFGAVGSLEGVHSVKGGVLTNFAEQELLDCVYETRKNGGCEGGWMHHAFAHIQATGRLADTASVPYKARDGACNYDNKPNALKATVTGMVQIPRTEVQHISHLSKGPIAVAFEVTRACQSYKSGIFKDTTCKGSPNHAVTMVGYDSEKFAIKNSWGSSYGDKGYIYMARNHLNCGLYKYSVVVSMKEGAPEPKPKPEPTPEPKPEPTKKPGPEPKPDPDCVDDPSCKNQGSTWLDWVCRYHKHMCCQTCRNRS